MSIDTKAGATRETLQEYDRAHHMHPFTAPASLKQAPPFLIENAKGCLIGGQGIQLLDMMAGLGGVNVGYGRKELSETCAKAMDQLSYYHSFSAVSNPTAAALAGRIAEITPAGMNKVFFANSGSEANETILKIIAMYWRKKNQPQKKIIITRDYAYHGSTMATTALNGNEAMHEVFGLEPGENVCKVPAPYWYRKGGDKTPEEHGQEMIEALEAAIQEKGAENIAAMFVEPIQGTMGAVVPPEGYMPAVEAVCRKNDILLVADEVVTGFGRTGNWFAQETFGFKADIMTLAKGMASSYVPISAAVIHDSISEVLESGDDIFQHGFTTSSHPVMCAVALRNIDILKEEGLIERTHSDTGPYFAKRLKELEAHPLVGEVRCSGLMAGIELTKNKETREQYPLEGNVCDAVSQACLMRGVVLRPTGNVLVMCPPLVINHQEIDFAIAILQEALTEIYGKLQAM
ncbi:aminotransferase class III-fold pyridoxal phosphate-dependent enzyme [Kordiimonas sp. SCSIO 12603]|uniref:aminotransferase n=1 Tax=Kordiimonas sp. SCSIO 12603 TaxID=2829596 RepID=UPI0021020104|nr:aminotransferase [Kordiimonas sp. SCSIO 12603]UTW58093.1 aminotransferase class III-fold pyridoxal phosphate-dependent enzyme [Kordiimonas sp. SCSIO 12603]